MQNVRWISVFALGLATGAGGALGVNADASPGDAIYMATGVEQCITAQQALCYATCATSNGSWTGANADMVATKAYRTPACETGFAATTSGYKAAPLAQVPDGATVHGVAQ